MKKHLTLILAFLIIACCQAQKYDLKLHLQKGETYTQVTNAKSSIEQVVNGQNININMTIIGKMTFKVISINSSDYEIEVLYESMKMIMDMPQGNMEFNSEKNDPTDVFSTILSKMTEQAFTITMDKKGKVIDVKNIESRFDAILSEFTNVPPFQMNQIKAQLQKAYGKEAFKGNMEMVSAIFPQKSVGIGEKWTVNTNLESGMSATLKTEYELSEVTADYMVIKGTSIMKTTDKDAYIESNGMPMRFDMSGTMISEIKIDKTSGWIIMANINQEFSGDVFIENNPQLPNGMKMTMKTEMKITDK